MDRRFTSQDCIGAWRSDFRGKVPFNFKFRKRGTMACSSPAGSRSRGSRSERRAGATWGNESVNGSETKLTILEARVGFEPTNGGFADLSLRPLGYRAETMEYSETGLTCQGLRGQGEPTHSYPPGEAEVYESEAGVGIGFAFEVGARGPAEGEEPGRARRVKSDRHDHPHSLFRFGA